MLSLTLLRLRNLSSGMLDSELWHYGSSSQIKRFVATGLYKPLADVKMLCKDFRGPWSTNQAIKWDKAGQLGKDTVGDPLQHLEVGS